MLIDPQNVDEVDFVVLLFLLNSEGRTYREARDVTAAIIVRELELFDVDFDRLGRLADLGLISASSREPIRPETLFRIRHLGLAFLIHFASEYLDRTAERYGEVPDNLTATLVHISAISAESPQQIGLSAGRITSKLSRLLKRAWSKYDWKY